MHERDFSVYRDASIYTADELFNPELRQSRNDWLDFVEARPYQDESGQVHDPVNGEVINPDEYFASRQVVAAESADYDALPMSELAKLLAQAEFSGHDSTSISDALINKLAAAEADSHSERDKEHNGIRSDNLWDRVMSIKDKELERLGGQPTVSKSKQEKLFEVAKALEAPIEAAVAGPKALLEERQAEAADEVDQPEDAQKPVAQPEEVEVEDVVSDNSEIPGQESLPEVDEELLQDDRPAYTGLESSEGYEGPALKLTDTNGQTYHLEGDRVKVFNEKGELVSTYAREHGENVPVARVGEGWKLAENFVTGEITSIEPAEPEAQAKSSDYIPEGGFDDESLMSELANNQPEGRERQPRGRHSKALGRSALSAVLGKFRQSKNRAKESVRGHKMVSSIALAAVTLAGLGLGIGLSENGNHNNAPKGPAATSTPNPSEAPEAKSQTSPAPSPSNIELKPGQDIKIAKDGKSASVDFK